jgi:hypothetical protein
MFTLLLSGLATSAGPLSRRVNMNPMSRGGQWQDQVSKWQLFGLLAEPGNRVVALNGVRGIVQAIEREDGSGHCFNVRLSTVGGDKWVFVRTAD